MTRPAARSVTRRRLLLAASALPGLPFAARAASDRPFEIGVLPNIAARVLLEQYRPMREWLAKRREQPVNISTAPSWAVFQQRTLALDYDVIVTAANLARVVQLDKAWQPILMYAPDIPGMVITPADKPFKDIRELKGKSLVLSNPQSLVAMRGMQWLAENGLQRDRDFTTMNVRSDDSVGAVVTRGEAAAAMLSGGEFRAIPDALKPQLAVLTTFARVPGFIVMVNPRTPRADADAVRQQLLAFTEDDAGRAFFKASGFQAIREVPAGTMEALDPFADTTRRALAG